MYLSMIEPLPAETLISDLRDARRRTMELVRGLSAEQLMGPKLDIVNPLLWEIGHLAWFHEYFTLRRLDQRTPLHPRADALYDSMKVAHDTRWDLPLPDLEGTLDYMRRVEDAMVERLAGRAPDAEESYLYRLTTFHEDMHDEAFTYSRQTLGYPAPDFGAAAKPGAGPLPGDVAVPGGTITLGSRPAGRFVFDNEKWAHPVELAPFRIARAPVTNADYRAFVEEGGYETRALWDEAGWAWREAADARHPVYWRREGDGWRVRLFDREAELATHQPVVHVNWHEANAWCRWAGRRLPTEAEWQAAAGPERYPWGAVPPGPAQANLDGRHLGCVDVAAFPGGDSAVGCRQMIGNVWEWTASDFLPYPGFSADPYEDYSAPWFGTRKVLRGGCWATRGRMITSAYRNFFTPDRRDVVAGFRTCPI